MRQTPSHICVSITELLLIGWRGSCDFLAELWVGHLVPVESGGGHWLTLIIFSAGGLKKTDNVVGNIASSTISKFKHIMECKTNINQNNMHAMTQDEISVHHANTTKVKYCKPSCYFPTNSCNGMCLLSLLRKPAGSTDAFPCLFYFSQPLTALHNCQN